MAIFRALTAIGIGRSELSDFSNESLIRIEKKLIAEQKLNNTISKNDVEKVPFVLKNYSDVLREVARYDCFYGILTGYDAEFIDTLARYPPEQIERIKLVVSDYLTDEITDYIYVNVGQNNWNNIRVLLHYRVFFNNNIIQTLTTRLEGKIEYAIATIQQGNPHSELMIKVNYLQDKDFYFTLGEVDKKYFLKFLVRLADLVKANPGYVSESSFFSAVRMAVRWYDTGNKVLANKLGYQAPPQSTLNRRTGGVSTGRAIYLVIFLIVTLFNLGRSCNNTTSYNNNNTLYNTPGSAVKSPWFSEQNSEPVYGLDSLRQDQLYKMEDFVAARLYPVNYSANSRAVDTVKIKKYDNPFHLDIFSGSYNYVKNRVPRIAIMNRTDKECVVISYFSQRFDVTSHAYQPIDNVGSIDIYAFYIPPHDSIGMDLKMDLLRFYVGQKLANFKTYRQHVYPDYLDTKFSKFTRADSMLFSKGFIPANDNKNNNWKKVSVLTISQPSPDSYLLDWTGKSPLNQFTNWTAAIRDKQPDSINNKKPLLLELKNQPPAEDGNAISSFIVHN